MFERFSDQARRAVVLAQEDARRRRFGEIRTENILMGVCAVPDGPAVAILAACGLEPDDVDGDVAALPATDLPDADALAALGSTSTRSVARSRRRSGPARCSARDGPAAGTGAGGSGRVAATSRSRAPRRRPSNSRCARPSP